MKQVFDEKEFDDQPIKCPKCGWEGTGYQAIIIDLYGLTDIQEVHCPKCDAYLGGLKRADRPGGESADPISFQLG